MTYTLGVDLGTSATTAAVLRDGRIEPCPLAESSPTVPSIVLPRDDGRTLIGEPAALHGGLAPVRLARSGDQAGVGTPGGLQLDAEGTEAHVRDAVGLLLDAVVDQIIAEAGDKPGLVAVACPPAHVGASTGPYAWLAADTTDDVVLVDAAVAVAALVDHERGLPAGSTLGVLDLGGDVCDAALVRRTDTGFARVGRPFCGPGIGGREVDTLVLEHVDAALDHAASSQDGAPADGPAGGLDRLRTGCRRAREQLLRAEETVIEVGLPRLTARVRLTRAELERLVQPRLTEAVGTLEQAVADAGLSAADLAGVVLVGGAARLPAAVALTAGRLRRPVLVGSSPELTTALGAALVGATAANPDGSPAPAAATTAGAGRGGPPSPAAALDGATLAPPAGAGAAGPAPAGHRFELVGGDPAAEPAADAHPAAHPADGRGRRFLGRHRRGLPTGATAAGATAAGADPDPTAPDPTAPAETAPAALEVQPGADDAPAPAPTVPGPGRPGQPDEYGPAGPGAGGDRPHRNPGARRSRRAGRTGAGLRVVTSAPPADGAERAAGAPTQRTDEVRPHDAGGTHGDHGAAGARRRRGRHRAQDGRDGRDGRGEAGRRVVAASLTLLVLMAVGGSLLVTSAGRRDDRQDPVDAVETSDDPDEVDLPGLSEPAVPETLGSSSSTGPDGATTTQPPPSTTADDDDGNDNGDAGEADPAARAPAAGDPATTVPPTSRAPDRPGGPPDTVRPGRPTRPPTTPAIPPVPDPVPEPERNLLEELVGFLFEEEADTPPDTPPDSRPDAR